MGWQPIERRARGEPNPVFGSTAGGREETKAEMGRIYQELFANARQEFVGKAFAWAIQCFSGNYKSYQPIDARYHDFEHTLQATLCFVRILRGRHLAGAKPVLTRRMFELGVLAILFHDTGYLKTREDRFGTGAKYTLTHVARSAAFARQFMKEKGYSDVDTTAVENMIRCTGVNVALEDIAFQSGLERIMGFALGTSDLLGQMAAPDYVDKLPVLFLEFAESARFNREPTPPGAAFASADDLMRRTPDFWTKFVLPRITRDFDSLYRYLSDPYPDGPNIYIERIEQNIRRLKEKLPPREQAPRRLASRTRYAAAGQASG